MSENRIKRLQIINIVTIAIIFVLAGVLIFMLFKTPKKEPAVNTALQARVAANASGDRRDIGICEYLEKEYSKALIDKAEYNSWLEQVAGGEYSSLVLSMWDINDHTQEWYDRFYGDGFKVVDYVVRTPEEIQKMLVSMAGSGNEVKNVMLYLDPYKLYVNYANELFLSEETPLSFSQMLRAYVLDFIVEHPEIRFSVYLPVMPQEYWLGFTAPELDQVLECWESTIHYSGWGNDVRVVALGLEKWVFCNPQMFENGRLMDDAGEYLFALENTSDDYLVAYDDAEAFVERFRIYVDDVRHARYEHKLSGDHTLVFFGDSILRTPIADYLNIPSQVGRMTRSSVVLNYALGGATASPVLPDNTFDQAIDRFLQDPERAKIKDETVVFLIEYGFNDYCNAASTEDFVLSLKSGIERLKKACPSAKTVLISPLRTTFNNGGSRLNVKGARNLADYVTAEAKLAEETEGVLFIDMYNDSPITSQNAGSMLHDGIHPSADATVDLASYIAGRLCETEKE